MPRAYWCFPPLKLDEVAIRLDAEFRFIAPAVFDAENAYEWFEAVGADGTRFNVSREHKEGDPDFSSPLHFNMNVPSNSVEEFGQRLAACLSCTIFYGDATYVGGNDFRYTELFRHEPPPNVGTNENISKK